MSNFPTNPELSYSLFQSKLNYSSNPKDSLGRYWRMPAMEHRFDTLADAFEADLPQGETIVMTHDDDYIPDHGRVRRHDGGIPFQPFQLHRITRQGKCIQVEELTRAFWRDNHFTVEGRMTERLGSQFYKLIGRIANRPNWRGYSYRDQFEDLAIEYLVRYALKFDHRDERENPIGYLNMQITNAFRREIQKQQKHHHFESDRSQQHIYGSNPNGGRYYNHGRL